MSTPDAFRLVRDLRIMQESEDERNGDAAPQTARHAAEMIESLSVRLYWFESLSVRLYWAERDLIAAKAELQRMRKEVVLP